MKNKKDYYMPRLWFVIMLLLLAFVVALFASSCTMLKTRQENKTDSTHTKAVTIATKDSSASGALNKTNTLSTDEYEKWRAIYTYPRDTNVTINNIYPQPTSIIYEREKGIKTEDKKQVDSSFNYRLINTMFAALDSTNKKIEQLSKSNKTSFLNMWQIIGLVAAAYLVLSIVGKGISNYSIVKK